MWLNLLKISVLCMMLGSLKGMNATYFPNFGMLGDRLYDPMCFDIPKDMTLCADIGYDQMRLPNLLEHDSLTEVKQQSQSWLPLINVRCHPYTQLFLCSLFTPVCLEKPIYPCRSLCNSVKHGCEGRMKTYGYNWPDMLRCDKFPEDNDMCIKPPEAEEAATARSMAVGSDCPVCKPVDTYESILDNFCRADVVIRGRIRRFKNERALLRQVKPFKAPPNQRSLLMEASLSLSGEGECCSLESGRQIYLIMGSMDAHHADLIQPTFVLGWQKKSKSFGDATKMFRKLNCSDPNLFRPSLEDGTILHKLPPKNKKEKKNRKKKKKNKRRKNPGEMGDDCSVCNRVDTYENILRHFCQAEFALRGNVQNVRGSQLLLRKVRIYKSPAESRKFLLKRPRLTLEDDIACCNLTDDKNAVIVMGSADEKGDRLAPTFILKWQKTRPFRRAVKAMKMVNCSDPNILLASNQEIMPAKKKKEKNKKRKNKNRSKKNNQQIE